MSSKKIAVFGLGSMGFGVATSLIGSGHTVWGFDVDPLPVERLQREGGQHGDLATVCSEIDIAIVVVLNAAQTESVLEGENGCLQFMNPDSCVIACSTVAADFARTMEATCNKVGIHYLDAPISGGAVKAAAGQLSVMASGSDAAFAAAADALDAMAETVFTLGNHAGPGSAMKSVNQLLAGIHIAAAAEAITFGMTQGIEPAQVVEVISKCAGSSWMFENRGPHIVDGDYTPHSSVNIWLKDLDIVQKAAASANFPTPLTAAALQQFTIAADAGFALEDDAAVAKVYATRAAVTLPDKTET